MVVVMAGRLGTAKRLAWIAAGFALALAAGALAVWARNLMIDQRDASASSGMYAAGDAILFVGVACTLSLVPALFLLRWAVDAFPRGVPWALLALSLSGPVCWVLFGVLASGGSHVPAGIRDMLGLLLVTVIAPRVIASPIAFLFVAIATFMIEGRGPRRMLSWGLALEALPIALFAIFIAIQMMRAMA
jgi:hypothetical protein